MSSAKEVYVKSDNTWSCWGKVPVDAKAHLIGFIDVSLGLFALIMASLYLHYTLTSLADYKQHCIPLVSVTTEMYPHATHYTFGSVKLVKQSAPSANNTKYGYTSLTPTLVDPTSFSDDAFDFPTVSDLETITLSPNTINSGKNKRSQSPSFQSLCDVGYGRLLIESSVWTESYETAEMFIKIYWVSIIIILVITILLGLFMLYESRDGSYERVFRWIAMSIVLYGIGSTAWLVHTVIHEFNTANFICFIVVGMYRLYTVVVMCSYLEHLYLKTYKECKSAGCSTTSV